MRSEIIQIDISDEYAGDIFWDDLLRKTREIKENESLKIIIHDLSWASDYQLGTLPFIFIYFQNDRKIKLEVDYPFKDVFSEKYPHGNLFKQDYFFEKLIFLGFFDFIEQAEIPMNFKHNPLVGILAEKEITVFQSFKNIANLNKSNERSRDFLYDFSGRLRSLYEDEVFGSESTANTFTRIIAKELIENISLHSKAKNAIARFKYYEKQEDYEEFKKLYSNYVSSEFITI